MVYHETMFAKLIAVSGVLAALILFVVMQVVTPATIHPVGLLGVFILLYITAGAIVVFGLYYGSRVVRRLALRFTGRTAGLQTLTIQRSYLYATVLAFAPVILIGMRSVGSFGAIDILLVGLFEVIACFYIWRRQ